MKKILITFASLMIAGVIYAQHIKLPTPSIGKGMSTSMVDALATRHSVREYSNKELTLLDISNLCWAACGVSRDAEHRTAPTAMNRKEITLFVFKKEGVYEYDATNNTLLCKAKGDYRALMARGQDFVKTAPVILLMVIDFDKFGSKNQQAIMMGCVDAGNVSENINLYCQAVGLATVPRATMDVEGIKTLLHLNDNQLPIMNNPVGYPTK